MQSLQCFLNNDMTMGKIMGLHTNEFGKGFYGFEYQTILNNVSLHDAETTDKINTIVVDYGASLFKTETLIFLGAFTINFTRLKVLKNISSLSFILSLTAVK